MTIPLVDLKAQYAAIKEEVDAALHEVIQATAFVGGPFLKRFEEEFAAYCGTQHAAGTSNGTDAIRLALLACDVKPGDEVITVPNTFIATTEAISMIGAKVRFVDVESSSSNMDPNLLEAAITPRTSAIIPVHLYGRPADMDPILEIAKLHNIKVIGDAAQAHGAAYKGRKIGTLGDAATFSFYPGKNLGAYGDAGAVVTDNPDIAEKVAALRDHGRTKKYEHDIEGFNCRMDGIQAAVLSVKLKYLEQWTLQRIRNAELYNELLVGTPDVTLPVNSSEDFYSVYHLYAIRTPHRNRLQKHLDQQGIKTGIHYPIPLHLQKAYAYLDLTVGSYPVAEELAGQILSLPMFPELNAESIKFIAEQIRKL